jgi:hypothetical protein
VGKKSAPAHISGLTTHQINHPSPSLVVHEHARIKVKVWLIVHILMKENRPRRRMSSLQQLSESKGGGKKDFRSRERFQKYYKKGNSGLNKRRGRF